MIKKTHSRIRFTIAACALAAGLTYRAYHSSRRPEPPVEHVWSVMGTLASITVPGLHAEDLETMASITMDVFDNINTAMSVYDRDSEISRFNQSDQPIEVSPIMRDMFAKAKHYAKLSGGAFDPTVLPLVRLWGFSGGDLLTEHPSEQQIAEAMNKVGIESLHLNGTLASFAKEGMTFDTGGIAKGLAVDLAYDALTNRFNHAFIINLGGDIRCHGKASSDRDWRIGIKNPFDHGPPLGAVNVPSGAAIATSGHYERFVMLDGKRYAHIIDPRSGYPVQGMAGVTVMSTSALKTDILSTALFVVGKSKQAHSLLAAAPDSHALWIPDRQPIEIHITEGFLRYFTPHPDYRESLHVIRP